jgi:thioredoxin 2
MTLDRDGVRLSCPSCQTTNRLKYATIDRQMKCGKCKTALPFPAAPIEVSSTELFDAATAESAVPVVVDFWAAWCGPCRMVAPEIEKVAQRMAGRALVLKVDTDANPELSNRFGIRSIPAIGVFRNGREITRASGVRPAPAIEAMVAQAG